MSKKPQDSFGEYLKYLRNLRGISITHLAKRSNVSPSYISRIENGGRRAPKPEIIKRMAPHLGIGYTELMIKAGYLTEKAENLWIEDEETKELFVKLTEGKKELLRIVEGLSEETIFTLVKTISRIIEETKQLSKGISLEEKTEETVETVETEVDE